MFFYVFLSIPFSIIKCAFLWHNLQKIVTESLSIYLRKPNFIILCWFWKSKIIFWFTSWKCFFLNNEKYYFLQEESIFLPRRVISWLMGVLSSWDDNFGKILRLPWYFCWYIKKFYSKVLTCIYFCKVQVYAVLLSTITLPYSYYSLQTSVLKFKTFLKVHINFQKFKDATSKLCN